MNLWRTAHRAFIKSAHIVYEASKKDMDGPVLFFKTLRASMPFCLASFFLLLFVAPALRAQSGDRFDSCMTKASSAAYASFSSVRYCLYTSFGSADTTTVNTIVARLRAEAGRRSNPFLNLLATDAYIEFVLAQRAQVSIADIIQQREALVRDAARFGDPAYLAWTEQTLANALYSRARQYDRAFEIHLRVYNRLHHLSDAAMPDRRNFLATIGHHYYEFGEYRQAIHFLSKAVEGGPASNPHLYDWRQGYTTLGLCYRQLGLYDSSDYYFGEALRLAAGENMRDWEGIAHGNLGINLYRRGRFTEATPLLDEDLRLSVARADWKNAAGALLPLAGIALEQGSVGRAAAMLDTARNYIAWSNASARLPLYHALRLRVAAASGDFRATAIHTDSLAAAKDSLAHEYNALHLVRAEQRVANEQMRSKLDAAAARQRLVIQQRNALVVILLLAAGLSFLGVKYYRQRRREATEKSAAALRAKESELEAAETALGRFRRDVQEKAELIEQLSAQLNEEEHSAILQQLRDATILTDAQWAEFRRLFEQVHAGFIARLGQQHAGLTSAEVRFLVLARLGFSTKEMAGALGISASSVRVIWHRVRKKLGLDEEAQAGAVVEGI